MKVLFLVRADTVDDFGLVLPSMCHFCQDVTYICNMAIMLHHVVTKQCYSMM